MNLLLKYSILISLTIAFFACKSSLPGGKNTKGEKNRFAQSVITLDKQACYGTCPVYTITVSGTGEVMYEGKRFVKKEGKFQKQLSEEEANKLFNAYECANFFDFKDAYDEPDLQDLPTTYVTFKHRDREKTIKDYYNTPPELKKLERMVEEIAEREEGWAPVK